MNYRKFHRMQNRTKLCLDREIFILTSEARVLQGNRKAMWDNQTHTG